MPSSRRAQLGDHIALYYKLSSANGETLEDNFKDVPLRLRLGEGDWAANLERCLIDLASGERHVFFLEAAQAFGHSDPNLVLTLASSEFPAALAPQVGALMEFQMPNGTRVPGRIQEVRASEVVVDFNHPLSDCPLRLEVEILEITLVDSLHPPGSR